MVGRCALVKWRRGTGGTGGTGGAGWWHCSTGAGQLGTTSGASKESESVVVCQGDQLKAAQ